MKKIDNKKGSTLIEILVSMLIIAIAALGGIALYSNSSEIKVMTLHKKMASELANSKMEEFYELDYDDAALTAPSTTQSDVMVGGLSANVADGLGMTVTVTEPVLDEYKQIQVDIDWREVSQIGRNFNVSLITQKTND